MAATGALLAGRRIAVLGSGSGLGLAVAAAAEAEGAEVLGIDAEARFEHLSELYRADPSDPDAMISVARALPEGLDGLALFPAMPAGAPAAILTQALVAPRLLAEAVAPRMAKGGAVVVRGAPVDGQREGKLGAIRAAARLRPGGEAAFVKRWALDVEPVGTEALIGWVLAGWAMAHAHRWPGIATHAVAPAMPDGRLPPPLVAATGLEAEQGRAIAAKATIFLLSDHAQGLTGTQFAADGGLSAQTQTRLEGL